MKLLLLLLLYIIMCIAALHTMGLSCVREPAGGPSLLLLLLLQLQLLLLLQRSSLLSPFN